MPLTEYRVISPEVLAEFRERGDQPEFWAAQWRDTEYTRYLQRYEAGYLGQFDQVYKRHLPKDARVIEAGCGRGQYVAALRHLGYDAIGVDFSHELVDAIRRAKPTLPIFLGDVRSLEYSDNSFGGYVSLGVVEHFWEGPEKILVEAHRVLKPGGVLLASVPHFSPQFRKRANRDFVRYDENSKPAGGEFYQFYFSKREFFDRVKAVGFKPIDVFYYDALYGAKRASPRFDTIYDSSYLIRGTFNRMFRLRIPQSIQARFAHMIMVIAQKKI